MKKLFKMMPIACLMATTTSVFAAGPTATLQVQGSVTQGACIPTLTNGGLIDLGDIKADAIPRTIDAPLTLKVECSTPTVVVYSFIGNRSDSDWAFDDGYAAAGTHTSGLGKTSKGLDVGYHKMIVDGSSVTGDNSDLGFTYSNVVTGNWNGFSGKGIAVRTSEQLFGFYDKTSGSAEPVAIKNQSININAETYLNSRALSGTSDSETIDGSITIAFKYL